MERTVGKKDVSLQMKVAKGLLLFASHLPSSYLERAIQDRVRYDIFRYSRHPPEGQYREVNAVQAADIGTSVDKGPYVLRPYDKDADEKTNTERVPRVETERSGVSCSLEEFIKLSFESNPFLPLKYVIREVEPMLAFIIDSLYDLETENGEPSHIIRSTAATDILHSRTAYHGNKRRYLKKETGVLHSLQPISEKDVFEQAVRTQLHSGPDLDISAKFKNFDYLVQRFGSAINLYYECHYKPNYDKMFRPDQYVGPPLVVKNGAETVSVWKVNDGKIRYRPKKADVGYFFEKDTYLMVKQKKTSSGFDVVDFSLCAAPRLWYKLNENNMNELNHVFTIGVTGAPDEYNDARLSDLANSYDQHGLARFKGEKTVNDFLKKNFIHIPQESVEKLTSVVRAGKRMKEHKPVAFFKEACRLVRKAVTEADLLCKSKEGRDHLWNSSLEYSRKRFKDKEGKYYEDTHGLMFGEGVPMHNEDMHLIRSTLTDPEFKKQFQEEWAQSSPTKQLHDAVKIACEPLTSLAYSPRMTLWLLEYLGIKDYMPSIAGGYHAAWVYLTGSFPPQHIHRANLYLNFNFPYRYIWNLAQEYSNRNPLVFIYALLSAYGSVVFHSHGSMYRIMKNMSYAMGDVPWQEDLPELYSEIGYDPTPFGLAEAARDFCVDTRLLQPKNNGRNQNDEI